MGVLIDCFAALAMTDLTLAMTDLTLRNDDYVALKSLTAPNL